MAKLNKKQKDILEQMESGSYKTTFEQNMEKRNANLGKSRPNVIAPVKGTTNTKKTENIAPIKEDKSIFDRIKDFGTATEGTVGNFLMGVEGKIPKALKGITETKDYLTKKASTFVADKILGVVAPGMTEENKKLASTVIGMTTDSTIERATAGSGVEGMNKLANSEKMETWRKENIQKNFEKASQGGKAGTYVAETALGVGDNVIPAVLSVVPGGALLSGALSITSATGSYMEDAEQRGMNEDEKMAYSLAMGTWEGGGDWLVNSALGKVFKLAGAGEFFSKAMGKTLLGSATLNAGQEALTEPVQEGMATVIADKGEWENLPERMLRSGSQGFISSLLLGGATQQIGTAVYTVNVNQNTTKAIQQAEQQLGRGLTEVEQTQIKNQVKEKIKAQMIDTTDLTDEEKAEIERISKLSDEEMIFETLKQVEESGKVDVEAIAKGVEEALVEQQQKELTDKEVQIEEKIAEQEATEDLRAKEIIQDEIDILQEEKTEQEEDAKAMVKELDTAIDRKKDELKPLEDKLVTDEHLEEKAPMFSEEEQQEYADIGAKASESLTEADIGETNENVPFDRDVGITDSKVDVETKIKETFGLKNNETKELYTKIANLDSVEQVREILDDYKDINETVVDDRVKEAKKEIRNTKLNVSEVKKHITDYNAFRKSNFNGLKLGNDGMAIDSYYQELAERYPEFFDSNVTNVADQLEALADFAKLSKAEYTQKVGEIGDNDLNQLAEELYYEVHAKEFNNDTNYKNSLKDLDKVAEQETVRQQEMEELKTLASGLKNEIKELEQIKKDIIDSVKSLKDEVKTVKQAQTQQTAENTAEQVSEQVKETPKENDERFKAFELSNEQKTRIQNLKDFNNKNIENTKQFGMFDDVKDLNKKIKTTKMIESAEIRKIVQGDLLIQVPGGLTPIELNKEISRLKTNYKGKEVIVEGQQGKIVGNAFGKIGVEFEDGTKQYVEKNLVQPVQDIDAIIKEQSELYKEYKQSKQSKVAPNKKTPAVTNVTAPISNKTLQVDKSVAPAKKVAVNQSLKETKSSINKESSFYKNITERSEFLDEEIRETIKDDKEVQYYQKITNQETMDKAMNKIAEDGEFALSNFLSKEDKKAEAVDVAEGWILLENYRDRLMKETDKDKQDDYAKAITNITRKMRKMGTEGGQLIQMFALQERLTPAGMLKYAESELVDLFQVMSKNKGIDWIKKYEGNFTLNANDQVLINENMTEVENINADEHYVENKLADLEAMDTKGMTKEQLKKHNLEINLFKNHDVDYIKRAKIAEIQARMQDKIPPIRGQALKAWMRMSMLFNPKTQVRNVVGNALLVPVNVVSDTFSSVADSIVANTTGVRTKGNFKLKDYKKGFKQGIYESWSDFKRGINTKNVESKYEISQGKSFNEYHTGMLAKPRNAISKGLNATENVLNFIMNAGDRGFMKASTLNALNNQIVLNTALQAKQNRENILISTAENNEGIAEVTYADGNGKVISRKMNASKVSEFIDKNSIKDSIPVTKEILTIAENEGLQRTWNDDNEYTKFVLGIRRGLNKIGVEGYGLGDVLIPFAKTPANITKAIVDYSPAGMVKTIIDGVNLKKSVENGQFTAEAQHQFVTELGKATAGTILYGLGTALAVAGMTSGSGDEDKDVKNFEKNILGKNPYSIEIFGKSFTYDWAQPISAPLAITADIVKAVQSEEEKELTSYLKQSLDLAGNLVLEQSFMQSLNSVFTHNDGFVSGLTEAVMDLPARAVPTFAKQIADMFDGTQRQTFEKGHPLESDLNTIKNKIPFLSDDLAPTVNTLGKDVQKYGGENNAFNVFFNPATVNFTDISEAGEEIYRVYQKTGEKSVMPVTTPYYVKKDKKTINLSSEQRAEIQRASGTLIEENVSELLENNQYKSLSDEDKAVVLSSLVSYSNHKAQAEILGFDVATTYQSADKYVNLGGSLADYYTVNTMVSKIGNEYEDNKELAGKDEDKLNELAKTKKSAIIDVMLNLDATDQQKEYLYAKEYSSEKTLDKILDNGTTMDTYLQFSKDTIDFEAEKDEEGDTISGSKGNKFEKFLLDSNMSDNDKATLYEYAVLSDFDDEDKYKPYKTIKSAGININYYLDFSSQEIESDKNNKGETIRNSKRNKTISYINTYNLSIAEKAIMIKTQYKSWDNYNNEIVNYVRNLTNVDYDEKVKMLEDLDFTINDAGDVYWK